MSAAREQRASSVLFLALSPCPRPVLTTWGPLSSRLLVYGIEWLEKRGWRGVDSPGGRKLIDSSRGLLLCKGSSEFLLQGEWFGGEQEKDQVSSTLVTLGLVLCLFGVDNVIYSLGLRL